MGRLKNLLVDVDLIADDQEFMEKENEVMRQYCIEKHFELPKEDMNEIVQRGMEDAYDYWKEEFGKAEF